MGFCSKANKIRIPCTERFSISHKYIGSDPINYNSLKGKRLPTTGAIIVIYVSWNKRGVPSFLQDSKSTVSVGAKVER